MKNNTRKINAAFNHMSKAVTKYLNVCHALGAPIRHIHVRTPDEIGKPTVIGVTYRKVKRPQQ